MDIEVASGLAVLIPMIVVDQGVVDIDDALIQINVAPPQSCQLPYPQPASNHHSEDGIPVIVDGVVLQEIQQEFLLRLGQSPTLLGFEDVGLLQLLQNTVRGIAANVIVIHSHIQHLMQYRVNAVDGGSLQSPLICQVIVEPLYIRFLQCGDPLLSEVGSDKGIVHIFVVFEGVVFQTTLQLAPEIEHLIDGHISGFCLDAIQLVLFDCRFFLPQFFQGGCVYEVALACLVRPGVVISTILSLALTFPENNSILVFSFRLCLSCHKSYSFLWRNRPALKRIILERWPES